MIEMPFKTWGKIRVWLDEMPPVAFMAEQAETIHVAVQPSKFSKERRAAAEFMLPVPGRPCYGLLGATFTPDTSTTLQVEVCCTDLILPEYTDNIAVKPETVRIGLLCEYVPGVLKGFVNSELADALGGGHLRFDCAAHGEIGSSQSHFARLSLILMRLLLIDQAPLDSTDLPSLFEDID